MVANALLLNLLIAMFSNTFNRINQGLKRFFPVKLLTHIKRRCTGLEVPTLWSTQNISRPFASNTSIQLDSISVYSTSKTNQTHITSTLCPKWSPAVSHAYQNSLFRQREHTPTLDQLRKIQTENKEEIWRCWNESQNAIAQQNNGIDWSARQITNS